MWKPQLRPREGVRVPTSTAEHAMLLSECTLYFLALIVPVFDWSVTVRAALAALLGVYLLVLLRNFWAWLAASDDERTAFIVNAKKLDAAKAKERLGGGWRWWHRLSLLVLVLIDVFAIWKTQSLWAAAPLVLLVPLNIVSTLDLIRGRAR
jgi:hypothetical protein